jgi:hypothetical protein
VRRTESADVGWASSVASNPTSATRVETRRTSAGRQRMVVCIAKPYRTAARNGHEGPAGGAWAGTAWTSA